jgi:signal transduction histidine kinase
VLSVREAPDNAPVSFHHAQSRARQWWRLLADRSAASALVAWLYAPVGVWASYVANWQQSGTTVGVWWIIVIVGQFVVVGFLPLIGVTIHRWVDPRWRSAATFAGIVITVMVRDLAVIGGGILLDVAPSPGFVSLIVSVVSQTGLILIIASRVSDRAQEQRQLDDLARVQVSLTAEDRDLRSRVGDIDQRMAIQIGLTLEPRIAVLDEQLAEVERGGDVDIPLSTFRSFLDDELLPLSHRLAEAIAARNLDVRSVLAPQKSVTLINPRRLAARNFIRPALTASVIGLLALPGVVNRLPLAGAIVLVIVLAGIFWGLLAAARMLLRHRALPIPSAFSFAAMLGGSAFLLSVVALSGPLALTQPRPFLVSFAMGFVLGILGAFAAFQDERFELTRGSLAGQIEALEDSTSTVRQQLWVSRRRLGYALHGGLQSVLHASMLRLAGAAQPTAELVAEVRADIRQAFRRATVEAYDPPDLSSVCAELDEMWSDTCDITWHIPDDVAQELGASRHARECSAEVIREAVQNSVRHGHASRIHIAAEVDDVRLVLHVSDDGTWKTGGDGLGSRMLDEFCSRWVRKPVDSGTNIRAEIVISELTGSGHGNKPSG